MALLQNQTIFAQMPLKRRGGVNSDDRSLFARGERRNVFAGQAGWSSKSGIPSGHLGPSSWVLPLVAGGMSSRNSAIGSATLSALAAAGINVTGTFDGVAALSGTGQLVVSGVGAFTGTSTVSGNIVAALSAVGTFDGTSTFVGAVGALANAQAAFTGTSTWSIVSYATGSMAGTFAPAVTLEAAGISGYLLDQEDVETGLTLRQALRLITAAVGGEVSGGGTTTITFRNALADNKDRIVATVDSNGNRTAITYDLT